MMLQIKLKVVAVVLLSSCCTRMHVQGQRSDFTQTGAGMFCPWPWTDVVNDPGAHTAVVNSCECICCLPDYSTGAAEACTASQYERERLSLSDVLEAPSSSIYAYINLTDRVL